MRRLKTRKILKVATLICAAIHLYSCTKSDGDKTPSSTRKGINLTDNASYANCFIVSSAGEYYFETKLTSGTTPEGIVSADWIWSTNDVHADGLVENVTYDNGYISFSAKSGKGNVVLGAFDKDGNVVWSWHLWLTEQPATQTLDNGAIFMDRNLGAMSADPENAVLTYGLKYQWGRKDPFFGGDKNEDSEVFSEANANTVFNPSIPLEWKAVKKEEISATVDYTVQNPTTFIWTDKSEDGCDWIAERNDYLWSEENTDNKTDYDPCPAGYRVAYDGAWEGCGYWNVDDDPVNGGRTHTTEKGEKFWWPLSGTRWGDADAGKLGYVGLNGVGAIWIRTTINCGYNASCFYYHQGTYMGSSYAMYRSYGENVRCTKES